MAWNWKAFENCTAHLKFLIYSSLSRPCRTLYGFSKIVLAKVTAFAILETLHDLSTTQKSLFANNYWSKQNFEKCPMNLLFTFIELSETPKIFVKIRLVLNMEKPY